MNAEGVRRTTGVALMGVTALAYFSRPWSCGYALSQFTRDDPVPYAHFDYHGWGVIFAWFMALLFAAPILWLASKVFLDRAANFGVLGRGPNTKTTILSILFALGLCAPMHSQISYLIGLPQSSPAPVWISSLVWLLVVEIGRTAAVEDNLLDKSAVRVAAAVAVLATIPKLALVGFALTRT